MPEEDIIDEEELVMLKSLKDLKRDYRENYSQLKGLKQELSNHQQSIDQQKEQIIYQFENWYAEEFEAGPINEQAAALNLDGLNETRQMFSQPKDSSTISNGMDKEDQLLDEDALVYKRAKQSVDELHRARKFEKSIKLK